MLAMNSPEVYEENVLFEGPNGQLLKQVTYVNGQEHLYEINEITGKQTHVAHKDILNQHETGLVRAEELVQTKTHYTMGGPNQGEYGQMDWFSENGALNAIFNSQDTEQQWIDRAYTRTSESLTGASSAQQEAEESVAIVPYTAHFMPSTDPTSISHSINEPAGKQVRVAIPSLERKTDTKTSTERPAEPLVQPEGMSATGVIEPGTLTVLGIAAVARGGKGRLSFFADKVRSFNDRAQAFEQAQKEKMTKYYNTDNREKNDKRKIGTAAVAAVAALAVLFGLGYCIANDDRESVPDTKPTTAPQTPGVTTTDPGKDVVKNEPKKEVVPTSVDLNRGDTVWGTAHELLESRGYNHKNPNTAAITNAMLHDMDISHAEARRLAIGTAVPVYTDEEIEDILDDFKNTNPHKIKK